MRDLRIILTNPFLSKNRRLSWEDFHRLMEDHLARISSPNTPAPIAERVISTANAYAAVFGKFNDHKTEEAVRMAMTQANDQALREFVDYTRRKEAAILSVFPKDTAEYTQFFPFGMKEYREMNKANAESLMTRIVNAVVQFADQLEPKLDVGFKSRREKFLQTRSIQLSQKDLTDDTSDEAQALRRTLEEEFYINLCIIGAYHRGDVEAGSAYINQGLIQAGKGSDEEEEDNDEQPTGPAPEA